MLVYLVRNKLNDKVYVGWTALPTFEDRWAYHIDDSRWTPWHFHRAIRKYSPEAFEHEILANVSTDTEAKKLEKLWILTLRSFDPEVGYNMTYGADGQIHTPESRKKMSDALKGRKHSESHKIRIASALRGQTGPRKGVRNTAKHNQKISEAHIGIGKGVPLSEEHKKKIGLAGLGRTHSERTKQKMSDARRRFWLNRGKVS